jgi:tetratricopeptide (TPR) repeat protein
MYKIRACFWEKKFDDASRLIQLLQSKQSSYAPVAGLYDVLIMMEERTPVAEVSAEFDQIKNPEQISSVMSEYILGRMAIEAREYETALKHFSKILVFNSRDPEWVPAATFQEGLIYKKTGYLEAASNVASELRIGYPDSFWGRRADDL